MGKGVIEDNNFLYKMYSDMLISGKYVAGALDPNYIPVDVNNLKILISGDYNVFKEGFDSPGVYLCSGLFESQVFKTPCYWGSSVHIKHRIITEHLPELISNQHYNPPLQYSWLKHGQENFVWFLVTVTDRENCQDVEQYYLDNERPFCDELRGYNIAHFANSGMKGRKASEETLAKMREAQKNRPPVSQETRDKLSKVWLGRTHSEETKQKLREWNTGRKLDQEAKNKMADKKSKTYTFLNPQGEIITVTNLSKFCRENNLSSANLLKVLAGAKYHFSCKGYRKLNKDDSTNE